MISIPPERIDQAYDAAPESVRAFIEEGLLAKWTLATATNYKIDTARNASFIELCRNALIGLVPPQEFIREVGGLGINDSDAAKIASAFNQEVVQEAAKFSLETEEVSEVPRENAPKPLPLEQEEIVVKKSTAAPVPSPARPMVVVTPPSRPTPIEPKLRTMAMDIESTPASPPQRRPVPPPPAPRAPRPEEVHADMKKYGIDPYREPIE